MSDGLCQCGHLEYIHGEQGCRGAYEDFFRKGLACTCKRFAPQPPVATPPTATLGELLHTLTVEAMGAVEITDDEGGGLLFDFGKPSLAAARKAVEEYVERSKATLAEMVAETVNAHAADAKKWGPELDRLRSDVERLEADALTPEEAEFVLIEGGNFSPSFLAKLTRIASRQR